MKKKTALAIVGALVLIGGLAFALSYSSDNSSQQSDVNLQTDSQPRDEDVTSSTEEAEINDNLPESVVDYLSSANDGGSLDATNQQSVQVDIVDFTYIPMELEVGVGTTVTWTNQDTVRHDVVSWSESPMSGLSSELLDNGESYSFTFDEPGQYVYFCEPHPFRMRGVVTVVE